MCNELITEVLIRVFRVCNELITELMIMKVGTDVVGLMMLSAVAPLAQRLRSRWQVDPLPHPVEMTGHPGSPVAMTSTGHRLLRRSPAPPDDGSPPSPGLALISRPIFAIRKIEKNEKQISQALVRFTKALRNWCTHQTHHHHGPTWNGRTASPTRDVARIWGLWIWGLSLISGVFLCLFRLLWQEWIPLGGLWTWKTTPNTSNRPCLPL